MIDEIEKIGFGGGCHWCTEAVFQSLKGVVTVEQGFIASSAPDDSLSEAVIVHFDPSTISLATLIEIHLRTHSSTSNHTMRGKYRSAVYTMNTSQKNDAAKLLAALKNAFSAPLVTRILPFKSFSASDARFQNYRNKNPDRPFCRTYIDPKLSLLLSEFREHMAAAESASDF